MHPQTDLNHGSFLLSGSGKETSDGKSSGTKVTLTPVSTKQKSKANWKRKAKKLQKELELLSTQHDEIVREHKCLKEEYKNLGAAGLGKREAIRLHRFEHLFSRIVNAQLPDVKSKELIDELIHDETKHMRDLIWRLKK